MKIVVYGCGLQAQELLPAVEFWGVKPDMCVDSSQSKQGELFLDKYVIQAPDILRTGIEDCWVLVAAERSDSICEFLISLGYVSGYGEAGKYSLLKEVWDMLLFSHFQTLQGKDVHFVFHPDLYRKTYLSATEEALKCMCAVIDEGSRIQWLQSAPPHIKKCYENFAYFSDDYIKNIFTGSDVIKRDDVLMQIDMQSEYVNVSGGMRVTTDQLQDYSRAVHFFGSSYIYGFGVEDKYTIPSCMQRKINGWGGVKYNCYNHGIRGMLYFMLWEKIESVNINEEDSIIIYFRDNALLKDFFMRHSIPYIDLNEYFWSYAKEDIYFDWTSHLNYKGNVAIANILYDLIFHHYLCDSNSMGDLKNNDSSELYDEVYRWAEGIYIENQKFINDGIVGSIVMNCNPFTLGHRHLIEIASQIVDFLFVFIVSEDCSEFCFNDRIRLVKEGTCDIDNIRVLPSGTYMISSVTFPEYFYKDKNQETKIDMTLDIDIFCKIIAKSLNIGVRFVGEEPNDMVTRQYNEALRMNLPKEGIKFIEIPRIKKNSIVISATTVRELFHEGNLSELKQYVPESTFQYLESKAATLV